MNLSDGIKMRGSVGIKVRDVQGHVIRRIFTPNTVCIGAQWALQRALLQITKPDDPTENQLWTIWAGTSNVAPTNLDTAATMLPTVQFRHTPTVAELAARAYDVAMPGVPAGTLSIQTTMDIGEGNGNTFCECGLYTRGNNDDPTLTANHVLVARQIHPNVVKSAAISIEYTWRFTFSI